MKQLNDHLRKKLSPIPSTDSMAGRRAVSREMETAQLNLVPHSLKQSTIGSETRVMTKPPIANIENLICYR